MKSYTEQIKTARARGVPLIVLTTADPTATIRATLATLNGKLDETPVMVWDCVRGLNGINKPGQTSAATLNEGQDPAIVTGNVVECLRKLSGAPEDALVFMHAGQSFLNNDIASQAVWNLRDGWKANGSTLIILATAGTKPPASLKDDIITINAALPGPDELEKISASIFDDAKLDAPDKKTIKLIQDATLGLSEFGAEQTLAMSLTKDGIDSAELWEKKRVMIEQTPGLSCYRGPENFEQIGGCENIKSFLKQLLKGKRAPRCVMFIDEIEKALAGVKGDTSGTSQATHGELLKYMQDTDTPGIICIGPPGAAKSAIAKATGNEGNIPLIQFDLKGMESSLVGSSLQNLKAGLATVSAIGQGQALIIATCNSFGELSPELKRRFKLGTFFFDLPTEQERAAIWKIYLAAYKRKAGEKLPEDNGWTGAEIKQAADIADRLNISLVDASAYIVPVAKSAADMIKRLRQDASGKFISASNAGLYRYEEQAQATTGRKIREE